MAKSPEQVARALVTSLQAVLNQRVECAVLYGSAARGEYVEGESNVNVMVLLDNIDTGTLSTVAPVAARWAKEGHHPPLIMEREQWRRAADVFAIELADMRDAHTPLHGVDGVATVQVASSDLRHQAERELRGKLLQLQTGLLMSAESPEAVGALLKKALPSFTTYLRAVLRLAARNLPATTPEVIRESAALVGVSPDAWLEVWQARVQHKPLKLRLTDSIVEQYHTAAEQTAVYVDNLREVGK